MAIFLIYQNNKALKKKFKVIEGGTSIKAGLFNLFWAMYHGFWHLAIVIIISTTLVHHYTVNENIINGWHIMLMISIGMFAGELSDFALKFKGYKLENVVYADDANTAEIIHIVRQFNES